MISKGFGPRLDLKTLEIMSKNPEQMGKISEHIQKLWLKVSSEDWHRSHMAIITVKTCYSPLHYKDFGD